MDRFEHDGKFTVTIHTDDGDVHFRVDPADAALIVKSCNAHDDLVAALRGLVNADGRRLSDQAYAILLDDAHAALAKAGAA